MLRQVQKEPAACFNTVLKEDQATSPGAAAEHIAEIEKTTMRASKDKLLFQKKVLATKGQTDSEIVILDRTFVGDFFERSLDDSGTTYRRQDAGFGSGSAS